MKSTDMEIREKRKRRIVHFGVSVLFVVGGILGLGLLTHSRSEIKKEQPSIKPPLVRTMAVQNQSMPMHITGEGTVRPLREVNLAAQVQGVVVKIADTLVNGGRFDKGDLLVQIDSTDYELAVTSARAKVEKTLSELMIDEAESEAAREEWRTLNGEGAVPKLVAKYPQLAAAKAQYRAAKADLAKAELQLSRTRINAPFSGRISKRYVETGEHVAPGQVLVDLFCVDAAEIVVPFADEALYWFHVPGFTPGNGGGAKAKVRAAIAGRPAVWDGEVTHAEGKLDPLTRMINVVIRVEKPYEKMPPMAPGLYVSVEIQGRQLEGATVIPRSALRNGTRVWVIDGENNLHFRNVTVARFQGDSAVLSSGLANGDMVAISPLEAVTDGMRVRTDLASGTPGPKKAKGGAL